MKKNINLDKFRKIDIKDFQFNMDENEVQK